MLDQLDHTDPKNKITKSWHPCAPMYRSMCRFRNHLYMCAIRGNILCLKVGTRTNLTGIRQTCRDNYWTSSTIGITFFILNQTFGINWSPGITQWIVWNTLTQLGSAATGVKNLCQYTLAPFLKKKS